MFILKICRGESHHVHYGFEMEFFTEIVKSESAWNTKGRHVIVTLGKLDKEAEYWPRLLKSTQKNARI